jgi:hypothetical protein
VERLQARIVDEFAALLYGVAVVAKPLPLDWPLGTLEVSERIREPWRQQVRLAFEYDLLPATMALLSRAFGSCPHDAAWLEKVRDAAAHWARVWGTIHEPAASAAFNRLLDEGSE